MFVEHKEVGEVKVLDDESKLLLKAANLIERRGWCQNTLVSSDGRLCLESALLVADGADASSQASLSVSYITPLARRAYERVRLDLGQSGHSWNDYPNRTKDEVVAKLRAVALGG